MLGRAGYLPCGAPRRRAWSRLERGPGQNRRAAV